jgi:transcriptional regulator with XRE-family HTH domain
MSSLKTGRQLQAARVLAGYTRERLAEVAGITSFTVKRLELLDRVSANSSTLDAIEKALAKAGIELLNDRRPGCRMMEEAA